MKKYKSFKNFLDIHRDLKMTMSIHILTAIIMILVAVSTYDIMNKIIFIIWVSFFTLLIPLSIYRIWNIYNKLK